MFDVMFMIYNTFIGNLLLENRALMYILTACVWLFNWVTILYTSFLFDDMTYEGIASIIIAALYLMVLIPSFLYITNYINNEHQAEAALLFIEKRNYKQMFDAL